MSYGARGGSGYGNFHRARAFHASRNPRSRSMDEKFTAKAAPSEEAWLKHPEKYDLPGVDTPLTEHEMKIREAILKERAVEENSPWSNRIKKEDIIWKAAGRDFSAFEVESQYDAMVKEGKLKAPKMRVSETTGVIRHNGELYKFFSGADTKEQAESYAHLAKVGSDDKIFVSPPNPKRPNSNWVVWRKTGSRPQQDRYVSQEERMRLRREAEQRVKERLDPKNVRQRMLEEMGLPEKPSIKASELSKYSRFEGPVRTSIPISPAKSDIKAKFEEVFGAKDGRESGGLLMSDIGTSGLVVGDLSGGWVDKLKNAVSINSIHVTPTIRKSFKPSGKRDESVVNFNGAYFSKAYIYHALQTLDTSQPVNFSLTKTFGMSGEGTSDDKLLLIRDKIGNTIVVAPRIKETLGSTPNITSFKEHFD